MNTIRVIERTVQPNVHGRVEALYSELVQEHRKANAAWRRIGELTNQLVALGQTFKQIQARLGADKSSLHRWAHIVRAFPTPNDSLVNGQMACMSVLNACVSSAKQVEGNKAESWIPAAREALSFVAEQQVVPSVRRLTQALAERRHERIAKEQLSARAGWSNSADYSVHNKDCVDVAECLDDGTLDLAWLDPCYFYDTDPAGERELNLYAHNPLVLTGCANRTTEASRAVLRRLIPILTLKLKSTGLIVYWANGRSHDDPEVMALFEQYGWASTQASIWRKWKMGLSPAGRMHTADAADGERYIVWVRKGKTPLKQQHLLGRNGLIDDDAIRRSGDEGSVQLADDGVIDGGAPRRSGRRHLMEKPVALAERFFQKYLPSNSMIFDAFGCSGSACIAALRLGHRFVYAELDSANFEYGAAMIDASLRSLRQPASEA